MRVMVTQAIDPIGLDILHKSSINVDIWKGRSPMSHAMLIDRMAGCVGLMSMPTDRVDAAVLDAAPLKVIAQHAAGTDNIDLAAAAERGVVVTNTPDVLTDATADLAMGLILAVGRRMLAGDRLVRNGRFQGWRPTLLRGLELRGSTLGIVGPGRIGRAVAERARAFGMKVIFNGRDSGTPLRELLETSDVVSLHCPLTSATRHLIGTEELGRMRRHAVLINTARGPIVDERALIHALRSGWIAGAGLDVFENEPNVHPALLSMDNAILLPHLGSATMAARRAMAQRAANNMLAVLRGEEPPDRVV